MNLKCVLFTISICISFSNAYSQNWSFESVFPTPNNRLGTVSFVVNNRVFAGLGKRQDGLIYNDIWEYLPSTGQWVQKNNFPGGGRFGAMAFTIGDKAYIAMGAPSLATIYSDLWEYNSVSDQWVQKASFPGYARIHSATFVIGNVGYIVGGQSNSNEEPPASFGAVAELWSYTPSTNSWLRKANIPPIDPLGDPDGINVRRLAAIGFSLAGKGYVGGGARNWYFASLGFLDDFWEYNPVNNTWQFKGQIPSPPGYIGLAYSNSLSNCDKAFVGLGYTYNPINQTATKHNYVWEYAPGSNTFTLLPYFAGGTNYAAESAAGFMWNGSIYAGFPVYYKYSGYSINGLQIVCTSTTFSINNGQGTVSWSSSNPSGLSINPTTGQANRLNNFNGQVVVTASISSSCGQATVTKTVWVGKPYDFLMTGPTQVTSGSTNPYSISQWNQQTSFALQGVNPSLANWSFPYSATNQGWSCYPCSGQSISVQSGSLSSVIRSQVSNTCGSTNKDYQVFVQQENCPPGGCIEPFSVFPNPARSEVNITMPSNGMSGNGQISLIDSNGVVVLNLASNPGGQIRIPLNGLRNGLYVLRISQDGATYHSRQIVVNH